MSKRYVHPEYANSDFGGSYNNNISTVPPTLTSPNPSNPQPNQPIQNPLPTVAVTNPYASFENIVPPWMNKNVMASPIINSGNPQQPSYSLPPYFRSVTTCIPATTETQTNAGVPLGITVTPGLVTDPPIRDSSNTDLLRCRNCNGYLSPYTRISDDYKSYICSLCNHKNQIPPQYSGAINPTAWPEFTHPVYDIIPPPPYTALPKFRPVFTFLVDVSIPAYQSGFTTQYLTSIKSILPSINELINVYIITFSTKITLFHIDQEREYAITDLKDLKDLSIPAFPPTPIRDNKEKIIAVIDELLQRAPEPTAIGNCLPSALTLVTDIMKPYSGNVFVGLVNIPTIGPSPLKPRNPNGEELERLQLPKDGSASFFRDISFALNHSNTSYHLFCAVYQTASIDLPAVGVPAGLTFGTTHNYGAFGPESCPKLHLDLFNELTTHYEYNAQLRLRITNGVKVSRMYGNFIVEKRDLILFPVLIRDKSISFELKVDGDLKNTPQVLFQLALLWTNIEGRRMIRIFNFSLPTSNDPLAIRSTIDEGVLATLLTKRCVHSILGKGREPTYQLLRNDMSSYVSHSLQIYSMFHLSHAISLSQILALPCTNGVDGRMETSIWVRSANITEILLYLYPRMFALDSTVENSPYQTYSAISNSFVGPLPLSHESFGYGNFFMFHTNDKIYFWISKSVQPSFLAAVFGVQSFEEIPNEMPNIQTEANQNLQKVLSECWSLSGKYLPNEIIKQEDPRELVISRFLIDSVPNNDIKSWVKLMQFPST